MFIITQVETEHILLGLIAEENSSKNGYLNSGLSIERAKAAVELLAGKKRPIATGDSIPFSRDVRRIFEAATNVRRPHLSPCAATSPSVPSVQNHETAFDTSTRAVA